MACGCRSRGAVAPPKMAVRDVAVINGPIKIPHTILPGESCIYCAEKHISIAYSELQGRRDMPAILGELELARRHTVAEYTQVSRLVSDILYMASIRDLKGVYSRFPELLTLVDTTVQSVDKTAITYPDNYVLEAIPASMNPFIGELHLYAAYRLAFEVGYMVPNKQMIIGDLALAREHLIRFCKEPCEYFRDFRHRVQTMRAADVNIQWPEVCEMVRKYMDDNMSSFVRDYADGLKAYLAL